MYVFFSCVTNKLSESLSPKFDVCTMSDNEGYNPTSEVCLKSTNRSLKTDVLKFDVLRLSKNCLNYVQSLKYYVCLFKTWSPKTKV